MLGFSTGALAKGDFRAAIAMLEAYELGAIELSALRLSELDLLLDALPSLALDTYAHVTLHAPSRYDGASEHVLASKLLRALPLVGAVVLHAEAIIEPRHWLAFGDRLLVENADGRKATGRTLEELQAVLEPLPQARICFDVAHVYQVDPTLIEARRMIRVLGHRIAQLHVSQLDHACAHHGLTYGIVQQFQTLTPLLPDVPVVLESCVPAAEIGRQLDLVRRCFAHYSGHLQLTMYYPAGHAFGQHEEPWSDNTYTNISKKDGRGSASYVSNYASTIPHGIGTLRTRNCSPQ